MDQANNPLPASPRVAVLVDTATTWGRGIISGIHTYSQKHGGWHLFLEARGLEEDFLLPRGWHGDGIIARIGNAELAEHLRRRHIPVVNVSGIQLPTPEFPRVTNDVEGVAELAVDYFLERGYKHFAYLSLRGLEYVARQRDAYQSAVARAGHDCSVKEVKVHGQFQSPDWNLKVEQLGSWLKSLPKPVAILIWSGGREVIYACQQAGLRVPQEVSLLCGSEDELLCECSPIPISGVQAACSKIGYEAAEYLDHLMRGDTKPGGAKRIAPVGVITRQSTDTLAISDRALVDALNFVQLKARQPVNVADVARAAGVSRSAIERRFAAHMGTSPATHLRRTRLESVRKLLAETELSIADVAASTGYCSPEYMTAVFRKATGTTPLRYRRELRRH